MGYVTTQELINMAARLISDAMPLGFIFCISEWCLSTFFGFVFGKRSVRGDI